MINDKDREDGPNQPPIEGFDSACATSLACANRWDAPSGRFLLALTCNDVDRVEAYNYLQKSLSAIKGEGTTAHFERNFAELEVNLNRYIDDVMGGTAHLVLPPCTGYHYQWTSGVRFPEEGNSVQSGRFVDM